LPDSVAHLPDDMTLPPIQDSYGHARTTLNRFKVIEQQTDLQTLEQHYADEERRLAGEE
jgi:hypothetical protein